MKTKITTKVQPKIPTQETELVDHRFRTVRVQPGVVTVLGSYIGSGTMVMKNYGPGPIGINYGRPEGIELEPGATRIIHVYQHVEVFTTDEKSALVEFEYIPGLK